MPDENVVLDGYALADEGVRGDFAPAADGRVLLHLNERTDLRLVAYRASVQIDQIRLEDLDPAPQDYVGGNWHGRYCIWHSGRQ